MKRSLEEIKARCFSIMNDKETVALVKQSFSPTAAYDMIFGATKDEIRAKAGRWLAVLRRDYPDEYGECLLTEPSQRWHGIEKRGER